MSKTRDVDISPPVKQKYPRLPKYRYLSAWDNTKRSSFVTEREGGQQAGSSRPSPRAVGASFPAFWSGKKILTAQTSTQKTPRQSNPLTWMAMQWRQPLVLLGELLPLSQLARQEVVVMVLSFHGSHTTALVATKLAPCVNKK